MNTIFEDLQIVIRIVNKHKDNQHMLNLISSLVALTEVKEEPKSNADDFSSGKLVYSDVKGIDEIKNLNDPRIKQATKDSIENLMLIRDKQLKEQEKMKEKEDLFKQRILDLEKKKLEREDLFKSERVQELVKDLSIALNKEMQGNDYNNYIDDSCMPYYLKLKQKQKDALSKFMKVPSKEAKGSIGTSKREVQVDDTKSKSLIDNNQNTILEIAKDLIAPEPKENFVTADDLDLSEDFVESYAKYIKDIKENILNKTVKTVQETNLKDSEKNFVVNVK